MLVDYKGRIHGARTTEETIKVHYRKPEVEVTMKSILPVLCASVWCGRFGAIGENGKRLPIWAIGNSYIWEIGTLEETRLFLERIQQYMHEKKEQVRIALQMLDILKKGDPGFEKQTERLSKELSELNRRPMSDISGSLLKRLEEVRKLRKTEAIEIIFKWLHDEAEAVVRRK